MATLRLVNEHAPLEHVLEALERGGAELQHRLLHRAVKQRMHVPRGGALALFAALFATLLRIAAKHMTTTRGPTALALALALPALLLADCLGERNRSGAAPSRARSSRCSARMTAFSSSLQRARRQATRPRRVRIVRSPRSSSLRRRPC